MEVDVDSLSSAILCTADAEQLDESIITMIYLVDRRRDPRGLMAQAQRWVPCAKQSQVQGRRCQTCSYVSSFHCPLPPQRTRVMSHPGPRNYSRPINHSLSSPNNDSTFPTIHAHQHPPFSDTNSPPLHQPLPVRTPLLLIVLIALPLALQPQASKRSKSAPRARAQPYQRPPSSDSSSTHVQRPGRDSIISQDSTATSVYPPSTVTSAFSGPDTPPSPLSPNSQPPVVAEHTLYIKPDDISSRLRLLAANSYFLVCATPHGPFRDASLLTWTSPD